MSNSRPRRWAVLAFAGGHRPRPPQRAPQIGRVARMGEHGGLHFRRRAGDGPTSLRRTLRRAKSHFWHRSRHVRHRTVRRGTAMPLAGPDSMEHGIETLHDCIETVQRWTQTMRRSIKTMERWTQTMHRSIETVGRWTQTMRRSIKTMERWTQTMHRSIETVERWTQTIHRSIETIGTSGGRFPALPPRCADAGVPATPPWRPPQSMKTLPLPYSHRHGTPVSPSTNATSRGNARSARTSLPRITTQRLRCFTQTQVLPVESLWPPL